MPAKKPAVKKPAARKAPVKKPAAKKPAAAPQQVQTVLYNEAEQQHYIVALNEDVDRLIAQGRLPFFAAANRTAIRPCDDKGIPRDGWIVVDNVNNLVDPPKPIKGAEARIEIGAPSHTIRYVGGVVVIDVEATAEQIIDFVTANPTLLAETIEAEKAGAGRIALIANLTDLAPKPK